jgi:hypothetical protein
MKKNVILCILLFLFLSLTPIVKAKEERTISSKETMSYFIDNLEHVSVYVNEMGYDWDYKNYKVYPISIVIIEDTVDGYLIDFMGENGYVVVGENLNIYDMNFEKDIFNDYELSSGITYEVGVGFSSLNSINDEMNFEYETYTEAEPFGTPTSRVTNVEDYINLYYGYGYTLIDSGSAPEITPAADQFWGSVYKKVIGSSHTSEGNCGLISAYNLLWYYRYKLSYYSLPYGYAGRLYDPSSEEPDLYYEKHNDGNTYIIYDTEDGESQKTFTYLYIEARQQAISINDSPEGLTIWQSRDIMNNIMSDNGYDTTFSVLEFGSYNSIMNYIDSDKPVLISLLWDPVYNSHTMMVNGYLTYHKQVQFLFFTYNYYIKFYEVYDGYGTGDIAYYDLYWLPLIYSFVRED